MLRTLLRAKLNCIDKANQTEPLDKVPRHIISPCKCSLFNLYLVKIEQLYSFSELSNVFVAYPCCKNIVTAAFHEAIL